MTPTKYLPWITAAAVVWLSLEACDCTTKQQRYQNRNWVTCVGNQPVPMAYIDNTPVQMSTSLVPSFNPADWDCTHPNSPQYKGSQTTALVGVSSPLGPLPEATTPHPAAPRAASGLIAYLPQQFHDLPFIPPVPTPANPMCDPSSPDVLQTDHNTAKVTRITTCPFAIKATIPVRSRPLQVAVTPDGSTALVTSFDNAVTFIDLNTNRVTFTLDTNQDYNPHGIAISPDGSRAYVTSFNPSSNVILVIDLAARKVIATLNTITYPQGATLTPDGSQLWITSPLSTNMDVIDTLTNTRVTTLQIGQTTDVAFNSTGTRAYITSSTGQPGRVVVVDTATYQTVSSYTMENTPSDIAMSYGDEFLVVNNTFSNSISVIDLLTNKVSTLKVGGIPSGIAFVR